MSTVLFIFNALDRGSQVEKLPKFHIVINNVSRFTDNYDPTEERKELEDHGA